MKITRSATRFDITCRRIQRSNSAGTGIYLSIHLRACVGVCVGMCWSNSAGIYIYVDSQADVYSWTLWYKSPPYLRLCVVCAWMSCGSVYNSTCQSSSPLYSKIFFAIYVLCFLPSFFLFGFHMAATAAVAEGRGARRGWGGWGGEGDAFLLGTIQSIPLVHGWFCCVKRFYCGIKGWKHVRRCVL